MAPSWESDPGLSDGCLALGGGQTKGASDTKALQEFIGRREQRRVLELFGALEWDPGYDYKRERSRG